MSASRETQHCAAREDLRSARREMVRSAPLAIVAVLVIGFVSVLAGSLTAMALPTLASALGTPLGEAVWVTTVFLLAAGLALPVTGWAIDRFGARRVLLVGLIVFTLGSVVSGLAASFAHLIVARAVQGVGGGSLEPACLALLSRLAGRKRLGTVMGLMAAAINVAPVIGPAIGSVLLSWSGWRATFLLAVPPMLVALALLAVSTRSPTEVRGAGGHGRPGLRGTGVYVAGHGRRGSPDTSGLRGTSGRRGTGGRPLDIVGLAMIGPGFTITLFAVTSVAQGHPVISSLSGLLGVLLLSLYTRRALSTTAPIVDPRFFADMRFAGAAAIMSVCGAVTFGALTLLPIMAARSWHLDGLLGALPLAAFGAGMLVSMSAGGVLSDRIGPRRIVVVGAAIAGVFFVATAVCTLVGASSALCIAFLSLAGLAFGSVSAPTFAGLYKLLPESKVGAGSTAVLICLQLGAALAVTVVGAVADRFGTPAFPAVLLGGAVLMVGTAAIARRALVGEGYMVAAEAVAE